jgi:hypothetical protein
MKFKIVLIVAIISLFAILLISDSLTNSAEIKISGKTFHVEIADEEEERERGLSNRDYLSEDGGMLFIFEEPTLPHFWMKEMNFPIDIIWISDGRIIGSVSDVLPEPGVSNQNLLKHVPPDAIDMALEVRAGTVKDNNILSGDTVFVPNMIEFSGKLKGLFNR